MGGAILKDSNEINLLWYKTKTYEFRIKRHKIDKDPIRRIIRESVRIERVVKDNSVIVMNIKEEHFGVQTVRGSFNSEWFEH